MPKLPWKRGEADGEQPPISSYLQAQPVDYTSMPVVEEEGRFDAFRRMPAAARALVVLLPLLLIFGGGWAVRQFIFAAPTPVVAQPLPEVLAGEARVVNPSEIRVKGETKNIPDGAEINAYLVVDEEIADWADAETSAAAVEGGQIELSLRKDPTWAEQLPVTSVYSIEVSVASDPPVTTTYALVVPAPLADEFYGTLVAEAPTATPEPTKAPAAPTATPVAGPPTLVVGANASMIISPTLGSGVVGSPGDGAIYQPLLRTPDSQFFLVQEGETVGWLPVGNVTIDPQAASKVAVTTPAAEAVKAGPLFGKVFNGGNIRYRPSVSTGTVLGQMHAGETVTLKQRTADGQWYRVVAPAAEGWVSVTLLTIDPRVAANVPTAE